jgi:hypothetical protein
MFYFCWVIVAVCEALSLPIESVDFLVVLRIKRFDWKIANGCILDTMYLHFT